MPRTGLVLIDWLSIMTALGSRVSAYGQTGLFAQASHGLLPDSTQFPLTEIMVKRLPVGQIVGSQSPRAPSSQDVEYPVDDLASGNGVLGRIG